MELSSFQWVWSDVVEFTTFTESQLRPVFDEAYKQFTTNNQSFKDMSDLYNLFNRLIKEMIVDKKK